MLNSYTLDTSFKTNCSFVTYYKAKTLSIHTVCMWCIYAHTCKCYDKVLCITLQKLNTTKTQLSSFPPTTQFFFTLISTDVNVIKLTVQLLECTDDMLNVDANNI